MNDPTIDELLDRLELLQFRAMEAIQAGIRAEAVAAVRAADDAEVAVVERFSDEGSDRAGKYAMNAMHHHEQELADARAAGDVDAIIHAGCCIRRLELAAWVGRCRRGLERDRSPWPREGSP